MDNPDVALDTHARLEQGAFLTTLARPRRPLWCLSSSFSVGTILPLLPWFFTSGTTAVLASVVIGATAAVVLGAAIGSFSGRGVWRTQAGNCLPPSWLHPSRTGWAVFSAERSWKTANEPPELARSKAVAENFESAEHHKCDDFPVVTDSYADEFGNVAITAPNPINEIPVQDA